MPRLPDASQIRDVVPRTGGPMASYQTGRTEAAAANLGEVISKTADMELDRIDDARAEDAFNRLREKQMQLTLDPEGGYAHIRGRNAVERKTPLIDEYSGLFRKSADEIASTLSTDQQRRKFKQRADSAAVGFNTDLLKHMMRETDSHRLEVLSGVVDTEVQNAGANWQNPEVIKQARSRIEYNLGQVYGATGRAGEKAKADLGAAMSKVHDAVVSSAMAEGDYDYAEKYFKENIKEMGNADVVRYGTAIRKMREDRNTTQDASAAIGSMMPAIAPDDFDRLNGLVRGVESGDRDHGPDGKPVTSKKGAKYAQQTMPATATNPGFGIKPAKDDSPEEYNRVGKEYLSKMLQRYDGDINKALAAYNVGPGVVDSAVAREKNPKNDGKSWMEMMPDETKKYVAKISKEYEAGMAGARPSLQEVKAEAAKRVRARGGTSEEVAKAQTKVESMYGDVDKSLNQQSDDVLVKIQGRVDAGEVTSYDQLSPSELSILGLKRNSARAYIEGAAGRADKALELSPAVISFFYTLKSDPVALKEASIAQISALAPEIGRENVQKLQTQRSIFINQPEAEKAAIVDADQFRATAMRMGYNLSSDKAKKDLLLIKDRTEQAIAVKQGELKRTLTREEKGNIIKQMMVEIPEVRATRTGVFGGGTTMKKRGYELEYPENVIIPEQEKAKIMADARRYGRNLSDSEVRDIYMQRLINKQQKG